MRRAVSAGLPRGLSWADVSWTNEVRFARDLSAGTPLALAGVVIRFEPIEGGEMEGVEAAGMPRDATAVFVYGSDGWHTEGRVLFNMTPGEALVRLAGEIEPVSIS